MSSKASRKISLYYKKWNKETIPEREKGEYEQMDKNRYNKARNIQSNIVR